MQRPIQVFAATTGLASVGGASRTGQVNCPNSVADSRGERAQPARDLHQRQSSRAELA